MDLWIPGVEERDWMNQEIGTDIYTLLLACEIPWTEEPGELQYMG